MALKESHISDENLLGVADNELPERRIAEIQAHLASCWKCRARMGELEQTIADFMQMHQSAGPELSPPEGARTLLRLRMAELAAAPLAPCRRWLSLFQDRRAITFTTILIIFIGIAGLLQLRRTTSEKPRLARLEARAVPDPSITPGATLPVTRNDVCAEGMAETVRLVPASVALQVFTAYRIRKPRPRAYELDYVITPALGGSDNMRNFWPQPYGTTIWNAHIKDALEHHLHQLVCSGKLDLPTAQQDIARDWTAAYRKYFHTERPLPEHTAFLKDRPWE